jgi:hypothetical protein
MSQIGLYKLVHAEARRRAAQFCIDAPDGTVVRFSEATRSLDQNAKMWAMLSDIAAQVEWHADGRLGLLTADDWKDILSAGLTKSQRVAQGVEGGFVMLGQRTSKMTVKEMCDLIEFAQFFGDSKGVVWSKSE